MKFKIAFLRMWDNISPFYYLPDFSLTHKMGFLIVELFCVIYT